MNYKILLIVIFLISPIVSCAQKTIKGEHIYYVKNYTEQQARQYFDNAVQLDLIEGIWIGEDGYKYSIEKDYNGYTRDLNKYRAILIHVPSQTVAEIGDIRFFLKHGSSQGIYESTYFLYRASWHGHDRDYNIEEFPCISVQQGASLISKIPTLDADYGNITGQKNESYIKVYPQILPVTTEETQSMTWSGSGFFLSKDGHIITNYHVIEKAQTIKVSGVNDDYKTSYTASVEISDKQNDLAILKITDTSFKPLANIPYTFKYTTSSVGEDCFVLGCPLISTMGMDIKLTNGIISSKTGFEGNIAEYQMSAPVQPGNSGGPLFDKNGNIIGIVCAKHREAENAGYAIKASYIRNLVELLPTTITMPQTNLLAGKTLPKQVELASKAVCIIIVNDD